MNARQGMVGRGYLIAGERNGRHRLTDALVKRARAYRKQGKILTYYADEFGVDPSTLLKAVRGDTWWCVK